jgi:hypothetical protein
MTLSYDAIAPKAQKTEPKIKFGVWESAWSRAFWNKKSESARLDHAFLYDDVMQVQKLQAHLERCEKSWIEGNTERSLVKCIKGLDRKKIESMFFEVIGVKEVRELLDSIANKSVFETVKNAAAEKSKELL